MISSTSSFIAFWKLTLALLQNMIRDVCAYDFVQSVSTEHGSIESHKHEANVMANRPQAGPPVFC